MGLFCFKMSEMAIKAIGFDLGGVLIQNSIHLFYERTMKKLGVTMAQLQPIFEEVEKPFERGEMSPEQFWQEVARRLGKDYDPAMLDLWVGNLKQQTPEIPHMLNLVDRLRANGYKLGLLSNTTAPHVAINKTRHIFERFDEALMSNEIGCRKPDQEAFEKLVAVLAVKPEEMIFIDDLPENVAGAEALGIHAIKFNGYEPLVAELQTLGVRV